MLVLPVVLVVPLVVPQTRLRSTLGRWLPGLAVPIGLAIGWSLYYNDLRFGSPFDGGYENDLFTFGFFDGLGRQLLSPGKGFFWYDLILIAALPGLVWLWKRDRGTTIAVVGPDARARALFFASWYTPDGFVAWGPRFLLPRVRAARAIPLGETIEWAHRARQGGAPHRVRGARGLSALAERGGHRGLAVAPVRLQLDGRQHDTRTTRSSPSHGWTGVRLERLDAMYNTWEDSPINLGLRSLANPRRRDGVPVAVVARLGRRRPE